MRCQSPREFAKFVKNRSEFLRRAIQAEVFETIFVDVHRADLRFQSRCRNSERLAAASTVPTRDLVLSARAAPIISRSFIAGRLKPDRVAAGSVCKPARASQLFFTERFSVDDHSPFHHVL